MLNPVVMTKLMVNAPAGAADAHAGGRRPASTRTPRSPRPTASGCKGWFIPSGEADGSRRRVRARLDVEPARQRRATRCRWRTTPTSTSCRPRRRLHDAGFHVLLFDVRRHGESAARQEPARRYGAGRGARLHRRRPLPALAPRRRRRADRGDRLLDGRQHRPLRHARVPADQGDPRDPADAPGASSTRTSCATEIGRFGPPMTKPMDSMYAALRAPAPRQARSRPCPRASSATPSCSTCRAPATRGGGWTSWRSSRRHARQRRPGDPVRVQPAATRATRYVSSTSTTSSRSSRSTFREGDQWGEMAVVEEFAAATPHTAGPVMRNLFL